MKTKILTAITLGLFIVTAAFAQRPPRPQGPPGAGGPPPMGGMGQDRPGERHKPDWAMQVDTDKSGTIDREEFAAAITASFGIYDRNANGTVEADEVRPPKPMGDAPKAPDGPKNKAPLPPFFFGDRIEPGMALTRIQFEQMALEVFNEMDLNHNGNLSREESRPPKREDGPGRPDGPPDPMRPPMAPNAQFIGAELRFGDKLVKGKPFSADIVIEDTRRLFDGSTVTKQNRGAVYRDGEGRTRREQPLEMIGGFGIVGKDNKPQMLVFINDFASRSQIFLDVNNKVARKGPIGEGPGPREPGTEAKSESLGTKAIDGVSAAGTRVTFEIPAGQIGNDKPMQVVSERWFSDDLQVVVMSRHLDPLSGEHIFKLVNIKRNEPSSDLFIIPNGFKVENRPGRAPERP